MKFIETKLKGCYEIEVVPHKDSRGWFSRTYCKNEFSEINHSKEWVQLNHSFTKEKGIIRGMHFQLPPYTEVKLVKCVSGSVYDVALDLRTNSNTFLKWFGIELSAENKKMILIPEGFAHGFQTLTDNCELIYHHTNFYSPNQEGGIKYDDPIVGINWPLKITNISEKDNQYEYLKENFKGISL
ncbi:MAG: dTDP-4-dehydrorhamnose 3,5-epimerase [Ginsengibacter sp.]